MSRTDNHHHGLVGETGRVTTSLASLLDALSGAIMEVEVAPHGLGVAVGEPVIGDRRADIDVHPGDLVLGVGVHADDPATVALIDRLAEAGATALVLRWPDALPEPLRRRATSSGLTLLRTGAHVGWGQLYTLVRTAWVAYAGGVAGDTADPAPLGDLFALANAIAGAVGGATTIEDRRLQVLAHSNLGQPVDQVRLDSIVGRRVPDEVKAETHELYRKVWQADGVYRVRAHPPSGSRSRLAVAVRAGAEVLGTIWVVEGESAFSESDERALSEAARVAALHLLRHAAAVDVQRHRRSELVCSVLEGRVPFATAAAALGIERADQITVVAFEADAVDDDLSDVQVTERLADVVTLHLESNRRMASTAMLGRRVYALLGEVGAGPGARRRPVVEDIVERASRSVHRTVRAGIGGTVVDSRQVMRSREEADAVLAAVQRRAASAVAHIDEVRPSVVMDRLSSTVLADDRLRAGLLDRLVAHDHEHHTDYVATVAAYLSAFGAVAVAAEQLFVHPNTLRYRLRRIADSTGVDLSDSVARFVVELELRVAGLIPET
mgnify:CR=1 FL=1